MNMKILIITQKVDKNDPILGFFHRWVEEFSKQFDKVWVICLEEGDHNLPLNVKILSLGKERGVSRLKYLWNFYKHSLPLVLGRRTDKVFVHMVEMYVLLLAPFFPVMKMLRVKFLWWKTHGHLSFKSKIALNFVDQVITASDKSFPVKTSKKIVVGHGIDTAKFIPKEASVEEGAFKILTVGRISPVKHLEDLMMAIPKLRRSLQEKTILNIVGSAPTGADDYFKFLQRQADSLDFVGEINFLGSIAQDELVSIYQNHSVLVNPSDTDSMDKVVLEAMACGVIPIASNLAYKEMLDPYGLYLPKRDVDKLTEILERVHVMQKSEKEDLKKQMRGIVVQNHNLENLAKKIYAI